MLYPLKINCFQLLGPHSGTSFLAFAADFPVESLLGISLLLALLYLSFQLGTLHSFSDKKEVALTWSKWLSIIIGLHIPILILSRWILNSYKEVHFNSFLISNFYITFFQLMVLVSSTFVLANSQKTIVSNPQHHLLEYPLLLALSSWFLLILLASNHFLVLIMGLIGFSVILYVLIMMFGSNPPSYESTLPDAAHEASIKYFYLSAFSSALLLIAIALLYTTTRTLVFPEVQLILSRPTTVPGFDWLPAWKDLLTVALGCYTIGFAFKLSAFPSHFWAPEVYEGSASPVTAFIIMPVKIATFGIFARTLASTLEFFSTLWIPMLQIFAAGSLIVGALGAFAETRFKRFIAYSSINQIGFLLMGLTTANIGGYQSSILFLIIYIITNIALFSIFLNLTSNLTSKPLIFLTDVTRIDPRRWIVKFGLSIVFFSLAGLPPFAGFFGKFYVLMNSFQQGDWGLVLVGVVTTLVSAYYYVRIVKAMWFERIETREIFTDTYLRSLPALKSYFYLYTTQPQNFRFSLYLTLVFLTGFLLINKYMLALSYQLAVHCSFAEVASWPS
jgi:NADH-quinone oxidoreductase subunit N